jgi:AraC-like DNA-binding protein
MERAQTKNDLRAGRKAKVARGSNTPGSTNEGGALYIPAMPLVRKNIQNVVFRHSRGTKLGGITQAGTLQDSWGYRPADPERHLRVLNCYQVVYVFEGSGRLFDATGRSLLLCAGDLILTFPHLGACYGPGPAERWSEFYIQFHGPLFDQWKQSGFLDPSSPIIHVEPIQLWLRRLRDVLADQAEPGLESSLVEICRLQLLLAEALLQDARGADRHEEAAWISKSCALLRTYPAPELDLSALAREMGTTADSFRKRFTRLIGVPPGQYRSKLIIDRACELLLEGSHPNRAIAQKLGFSDEYHFSRRFKQITGVTPTQYRQRLPGVDRR